MAAADRLLSLVPNYATWVRDDYRRWHFAKDLIDHIIDGLRKAGLDVPDEPVSSD